MLSKALYKGFSESRLRLLLAAFFLALAIPTAALVWQAYSQLKWEAFHQYRGMAEELTGRINSDLMAAIESLETRSFADYSFHIVSNDPSTNFLQPSILSTFPVRQDIAGLLGYFQVGIGGEFTTPLLPEKEYPPDYYGISNAEYQQRQALAQQLRAILNNNQLVAHRPAESAAGLAFGDSPAQQQIDTGTRQAPSSQRAFDKLNEKRSSAYQGAEDAIARDDAALDNDGTREREAGLGRVTDLKLDATRQKKSADIEIAERAMAPAPLEYPARLSRKEKTSLAEPVSDAFAEQSGSAASNESVRIRTFESEIDPLVFSLLDSGHFVLFRTVWREGQRFIQGMLLEQTAFIKGAIETPFHGAALSGMSTLIVAYQDDLLSTTMGRQDARYIPKAAALEGELLYRSRLAAPFDNLEVIYSVNHLPPGPGAGLVVWVSVVLGLVLCIGFYSLYRLGLRQMRLARQQQDFVSAVSHELKTPLTSIRMYGEMLKEGWAAEDKKQAYYEFIFDESERLSRLISNVLQLSNISREQPQLELKPTRVNELMDSIQSKIATQVEHAGFELVIMREPQCDRSSVSLDNDYFSQIIINLVDNAIKFSRKSAVKRLEIGARHGTDKRVVFFVRDFGPGIARDQMRKIFDMFYRSESELTRETVGTGIGLAVVHQLSAAMGARVDVLNREPGAEFQVSVPEI